MQTVWDTLFFLKVWAVWCVVAWVVAYLLVRPVDPDLPLVDQEMRRDANRTAVLLAPVGGLGIGILVVAWLYHWVVATPRSGGRSWWEKFWSALGM